MIEFKTALTIFISIVTTLAAVVAVLFKIIQTAYEKQVKSLAEKLTDSELRYQKAHGDLLELTLRVGKLEGHLLGQEQARNETRHDIRILLDAHAEKIINETKWRPAKG